MLGLCPRSSGGTSSQEGLRGGAGGGVWGVGGDHVKRLLLTKGLCAAAEAWPPRFKAQAVGAGSAFRGGVPKIRAEPQSQPAARERPKL